MGIKERLLAGKPTLGKQESTSFLTRRPVIHLSFDTMVNGQILINAITANEARGANVVIRTNIF